MIKVACLSCSAPYDLDERRLPATGLRMRCPKCGTSFAVFPDGRVEAAAAVVPKKTQMGMAPATGGPLPAAAVAKPIVPAPAPRGAFGGGGMEDFDAPSERDELDLPAPRANATAKPALAMPPAPEARPIAVAPPQARAPIAPPFVPAAPPAAAGREEDFDFDLPAPRSAKPASTARPNKSPLASATDEDFDFDLPAPRTPKPAPSPAASKPLPPAPAAKPFAPSPAANPFAPSPAAKPFAPSPAAAKPLAAAPAPANPFAPPAAKSPSAEEDFDFDLPAPRGAKPAAPTAKPAAPTAKPAAPAAKPAAPVDDDFDFDLPAPRGQKPAPAAAKPAAPASGDFDFDLPAPRGQKPAPGSSGLDIDLPAPRGHKPAPATARTAPDLELDLPAPRGPKPAAKGGLDFDLDLPSPPPPALADVSRTPFDDEPDLPATRGAPGLELDLPAPRGARRPAPDADAIGTRPGVLAAAADAFGDLDLPMPKASGSSSEFGDLELPTPSRGHADLPALSGGRADLPALSGGAQLPALSGGRAELPSLSGGAQLPALSGGRAELPSLSGGAQLPTLSGGRAELPSLSGGAQLPTLRGGREVDLPPAGSDGFGDLELPLPGGNAPRGGSFGSEHDDDLELPLPGGGAPHGGPQRGHGEVDLGGGGDDMEFADIPQASPDRAVSATTTATTPKKSAKAARGSTSNAPQRRSRGPLIVGVAFAGLLVVGGALTFTPLGPFGLYAIEPFLPAAGDPAQIRAAIQGADELALHDVRGDSWSALQQLATARHDAGLSRELLTRSLLHEALFQIRFGGDSGSATRAAAIRQRLEQRGLEDPAIALGLAADELRRDNFGGAAASIAAARALTPSDPFVDLVAGELALEESHPAEAVELFRAAAEHGGGGAAQWGIARALLGMEREAAAEGAPVAAADVDAAVEATLAASARHAGARVEKARRLWATGDEAGGMTLARQVVGQEALDGEFLAPSITDRASAWELLGSIHERRGRTHQAREAYSAATELDGTRVRALLGAGRTMLADRPADALARFESVLEVPDSGELPSGTARSPRDEARLGRARALVALDRVEEGRTELETLAGERTEDAEVMLWLGRVEERLEHGESAEQHYREAVRLAPTTFDGYLALANYYAGADRGQDGIAVLEQARSQVAENAEMREALGRFELSRNRLPEAIRELRRALALDPELPGASFGLGVALRRSSQLDEAAQVFERTAEIDPGHPGLALERGLLYEARGQAERAVEFYGAALTEHPDDAELLLRLGAAQVAANHIDDAAVSLERVQRMLPSSAEAEHFLGRVAFAREQVPEAITHFERAVSLDATRGEFFLYAAWAQIEVGNIGRALERAESAIARDPSLGDAYWIRGRVHLRAGAVRDALTDLQRALDLKPERYEALAAMGDCYDQLRQLPQAVQAYERAVAARDTQGEWWYRLGRLRLDASQRAEAVRALGRATLIGDATTPQPHWLADAHRLQGDALRLGNERAGAIEHYRRYLELAPAGAIDRAEVRDVLMDLGSVPPEE